MINRLAIIALISIFCFNLIHAQQITFKPWNDSVYGAIDTFPANAVADDFGPRRCCGTNPRNFHGGIDYNSSQNTGNNGNDDIWDMILAPEDGTIVDVNRLWTNQYNYKQLCYEAGDHRFIFGHVYDSNNTNFVKNDSTIILKGMIAPNTNKWAQILIIGNDTLIYGQVNNGQVVWNGDTLATSNVVTAGNPLVPLGESAARGAAHLHLNTVPLVRNYSDGATTYNSNPLQYIDYNKAHYDISLFTHFNTNGISISYPGTQISPIASKVEMTTTVSGIGNKRYDHIFDVNKVKWYITGPSVQDSLLRGPAEQSVIDLGGRLNHSKHNHPSPQFGSWTITGVDSRAYNSQYTNQPHDIYHFSDFVTRIHTADVMGDNTTQIADCPNLARYPDGRYHMYAEVTDVRNATFRSDTLSFVLDNWKPYVRGVKVLISGIEAYNEEWICNGDCMDFTANNLGATINHLDMSGDIDIIVNASEPMRSMSLTIASLGIENELMTPSADSTEMQYTIDSVGTNLVGVSVDIHLSGQDVG